ncbi:MAG TPA: N-acetylneuraminate synthase family protein [Solirubrobacteraceae bacterium]|nr:N-acetylneuraminate synthase family protein [Solirubrobacteraceae bacterium]
MTDRSLTIGDARIDDASDCYVIAEIGHNHQGSVEQAKLLFAEAKRCGVDAVKVQKRDNRSLYTDAYFNKPYENENSFGPTYGLHREALELGRAEYEELCDYAREIGVTFFATAFDQPSADFLADLDMPAYKIASGDLTNTPLLRHVARIGKPVILSTGGATLADVQRAYAVAREENEQVAVLQCTAGYPAAWDEINLRVIQSYREAFPEAVVGLSSHDNGIAMAAAAYALGARIVEKHFTLDRSMRGTDHSFSLEPQGLRKMVRDLRRLRVAVGDGEKRSYQSEAGPLEKMSKKLVAARDLPQGHVLGPDDIATRSPGDGLPPYEIDRVLGKVLLRALAGEQELTFEVLGAAEASAAPVAEHGV